MNVTRLILSIILISYCVNECVHDQFINSNSQYHYYEDLTEKRMLQTVTTGGLRVFADYTQLNVPTQQSNRIRRMTNITANYFYSFLTVQRLDRLFFPANTSQQCNILRVPDVYVSQGTIGDIGIIVGGENVTAPYMAKSTPCAFLRSNSRPIWGVIIWNINSFKNTNQGFQEMLFVGLHQMTHVLGFSASMYGSFPGGNVLQNRTDGSPFLSSASINSQVRNYFGCPSAIGLNLQDQDGTLIGSHWQKRIVGNQFMIASNKKQTYVSRFTAALFNSTGWYPSVNYSMTEPMTWGRAKGCGFLNIDDCNFTQFCNDNSFQCDWDGTGIGRCNVDPFTGSCLVPKYFTNTICIEDDYQLRNLNAQLGGFERGGHNSRCHFSDFRQIGLDANALNFRCYITICGTSGAFLYLLIKDVTLVCTSPNQVIPAPPSLGISGTLTCPSDFSLYCTGKKTCPFNCNQNGACINGRCLCTGATTLTSTCSNVNLTNDVQNASGGRILFDLKQQERNFLRRQYSFADRCQQGSIFDPITKKCQNCLSFIGCDKCDQKGCIECPNGQKPYKGICKY